ncbi:type IV pilus modification PilV family protein [Rubinisphaera margarita]|uniref:type IV pilus modification PilV family protein n=1 Tax=Rubinisphaera margarita TaxID=2909586 RepID=UPI001EE853AF|nr:type II secretion system protein [Rubinisphaera margarita]MCG6154314.1 type II secretion system GspH family protein [Rubinisphaera margarita]
MKNIRQTQSDRQVDGVHFRGATLVEILMSLMIMGVGLVSVASLFPIAMLRSIQATQLTNAALLNYQCEDYIRAFPEITRDHYDNNGTPANLADDRTVPNLEYTPNSKAWGRVGVDATDTNDDYPAPSGNGQDDWLDYLGLASPKVVTVIDPVGILLSPVGDTSSFGTDFFGLHPAGAEPLFQNDRKNGGFNLSNSTASNLALQMFSSNDSWTRTLVAAEVVKTSGTQLTLNDIDSTDIAVVQDTINSGVNVRAIVFDENLRQSHVSPVTSAGGNSIVLTKALPTNGLFDYISEVVIEIFEPRYSCMITVRRQLMSLGPAGTPGADLTDDDNLDGDDDDTTNADDFREVGWPGTDDRIRSLGANVVVFFRRDFTPISEQVYEAGNLRKGLLTGQSNVAPPQITIRWSSSIADSKPRLKEGAYVFDPSNGYWYQIRSVVIDERASQQPRNSTNDREAVILLDKPPQASGQFLMVPEGVVEVFDYPGF